ncbi:hypothetical protein [Sphaerisporangium corydalis]|uniref:Uncharacterized protein n=1 Tax=Sphaerisporangium corydalis TaxID=1441875 RepID=A0ABV9EAL6_9ACTN|nr:hypothetical protein [Sphaerisporangium corydalis]
MNQVQLAVGVDSAARATQFIETMRGIPALCPQGRALGKYPFRLTTGPARGLGDEDVTLHMTVSLPHGYDPLELDTGFTRVGGLVILFYGTSEQVSRYLPLALASARSALAGTVPGV